MHMVQQIAAKTRTKKPAVDPKPIVNARHPVVSVIIPVMNEIARLARVIQEARRVHHATEVVVVVNGSRDGSRKLAERMGARVINFRKPLGHDVGRSVGARAAKGDILLFTDGDIVIPAAKLRPFVKGVVGGLDVALNRYAGPVNRKKVHSVVLAKHALNALLRQPQLKGYSLTAIPHALSRKALEQIGPENLAVPPKAQAIAVSKGLKIRDVAHVDVGKPNPRKRRGPRDYVANLIVGDHLEAIHTLLETKRDAGIPPVLDRIREVMK
jgi:glycosyltransferase involved in cell wall biosynthesis